MRSKKNLLVYLVEDDDACATVLSKTLTDENEIPVSVKRFHTGEECLNQLTNKPDVIILDYNLNSLDANSSNGSIILRKIKNNYPFIKVIMLSSQNSVETAMKVIKLGADDYIFKGDQAYSKINKLIQKMGSKIIDERSLPKRDSFSEKANLIVLMIFITLLIISRIL